MEILYEDNHLIAVNKQSSDIVQGDRTGDEPLSEKLKLYLKEKYGKPGNVFLGVIHRLDRPVSGAVVFARTGKALTRMNEMLKERKIRKIYWAVVSEMPPSNHGILIHYIYRDTKKNKSFVLPGPGNDSSRAELKYTFLGSSDRYHLLEIELITGRHHQIRVQLSHTGCPIKGDIKYGSRRTNRDGSIHLHAREIQFEHPVTRVPLCITAPLPSDPVWDFFNNY